MTDELEDKVIEAMARAMAIAESEDPDRDLGWKPEDFLWKRYSHLALKQYRAFLAMQSILLDQRPVQATSETDEPSGDHPDFDESAMRRARDHLRRMPDALARREGDRTQAELGERSLEPDLSPVQPDNLIQATQVPKT